jgi:biopolymer transport protein TolR
MRSSLRAEINVTPLVDVCLVLLIIMMVVTPLMNPTIEVPKAPEPQDWGAEPARSKVTLSYGPPVAIRVDDDPNPMGEEALATLLFAIHAQDPRREISLRADRRLAYGEVKRVLRFVQSAGFPAVGLVAERLNPKSAP